MDVNMIQQETAVEGQASAVCDMPVKPYKLRRLQAKDITPMAKIIGKIGIDKMISCYGDDDFTELMIKLKNRKRRINEEAGTNVPDKDNSDFIVGVAAATRIANQVLMNLDKCDKDLYGLLGSLSGMEADKIAELELNIFIQMIVDVISENNVVNFIKAAIKLLN